MAASCFREIGHARGLGARKRKEHMESAEKACCCKRWTLGQEKKTEGSRREAKSRQSIL